MIDRLARMPTCLPRFKLIAMIDRNAFSPLVRRTNRREVAHRCWALSLAGALLAGCSYSGAQPAECTARASSSNGALVRLVVQFRVPTQGDAPEVLKQLQAQTLACFSYLSSASPTVHVYAVRGGGDEQVVRENLRRWSAIQAVERDSNVQPAKLR